VTSSTHDSEPERLDTHRAARAAAADPAQTPADPEDERDTPEREKPASFAESSAVVRARQLERLREAVDSGDYRPDPGRIAESMLENERT
jgi:anti-sigma28 factor (negative regulator of flagellin synthesis)